MYQYANIKTELNLLIESFEENKRLYFLTHFSGVLLYILVLFLNFYRNPFYAGAFDPSDDSLFDKLLLSNFYLTLWYVPFSLIYVVSIGWIVELRPLQNSGPLIKTVTWMFK